MKKIFIVTPRDGSKYTWHYFARTIAEVERDFPDCNVEELA